MTVSIDEMRPKLRTLDQLYDMIGATEPVNSHPFGPNDAQFTIHGGWEDDAEGKDGTDQVLARISLDGTPYPLTKDALLEASSLVGINKTYAARCPAPLLQPQLNYWFSTGTKKYSKFQLLTAAGRAAALTRHSIQPFSNVKLLDETVAGIRSRFGDTEILVDYKLTHSLRRTHIRLILPEIGRTLTDTGTDDDHWSLGIQLKNSLIGHERTSLDGYVFRWACTNGQIDTHAQSGVWRRTGGERDNEVYEWARNAVDEILGGLEPALDAVQNLAGVPVEGEIGAVLRDVFDHYRVPLPERAQIIANVIATGGRLTMYTLMNAITQVANRDGMEPSHVETLMRMGGDLPHAAHSRCAACRRLLATD